jgi:3-oxoacyl-[acyl-carrier-protein] synthase-3
MLASGRDSSVEVFVNEMASFLPNAPVGNSEMEHVLGKVCGVSSRARSVVLRRNGIRLRYYALDPATGRATHTNAGMTAEAVRRLAARPGFSIGDIDLLCCGTSTPDVLMPGHASMVHGELGSPPCETVSTAGICLSGMAAFRHACLAVRSAEARCAVATGSELVSPVIRSPWCEPVAGRGVAGDVEKTPALAFDADFLRWMLSDGAGAALLQPAPAPDRISLKVEWIETCSFANELETCMYMGGDKQPDGRVEGWRTSGDPGEAVRSGRMLIKQDVRLLDREIVRTAVDRALTRVVLRRGLDVATVDWFVPHYSSEYFREPLAARMRAAGLGIPEERWFTNLSRVGNTGAGSIYIMLDELLHSGRLARGQRILAFIPESGRFSVCYMLLTVQ